MRIAIMGGGFIGKNLAKHYTDLGAYVDVLDKDDFSFLDSQAVRNYFSTHEKYDVVFFSAYIGGTRATGYNDGTDDSVIVNNVRMFDNIGNVLDPTTKYIYFGSGAQYSKDKDLKRVKEEELGIDIPTNEYGYAKYLCAKMIEGKENFYDVVLFGIYGQNEDPYIRFITNSCYKAILDLPIIINQDVVFDYLYIKDLFKICDKIIYGKSVKYRVFNATPNQSISLKEIAEIIKKISKKDIDIIINNPGLNFEYTGSNEKLIENFGDIGFTSYEDGIKEIYDFCATHMELIDEQKVRDDAAIKNCVTKK